MRLLPNWCLKKTPSGRRDEGGEEGGEGAEGVFQDNTSCLESLRRLRGTFSSSRSTRTHLTNVLVTVVGVAVVVVGAYFSRDYVRRVLLWVAGQEAWVVVLVFLALFTLVSMPLMWGYIVVNISAGYMFGTWRGLAVTVTTATAGVFVAHILIRMCLREIVHRRVVTSRLLRALLSVLGGSQAFKVVAITRLTPIPFGLQNAVFAVSRVPTWLYLLATVLGLLPTQVLNCYLGTTVRSFDDVVSQSSSASATAWGVFAVQVLISVGLTMWVLRRARMELHKTVAAQLSQAPSPAHTPTHSPSHQPTATTPPSDAPPEVIASHLEKVTAPLPVPPLSPTPPPTPTLSPPPPPPQPPPPPPPAGTRPTTSSSFWTTLREAAAPKKRHHPFGRQLFGIRQVAPLPPLSNNAHATKDDARSHAHAPSTDTPDTQIAQSINGVNGNRCKSARIRNLGRRVKGIRGLPVVFETRLTTLKEDEDLQDSTASSDNATRAPHLEHVAVSWCDHNGSVRSSKDEENSETQVSGVSEAYHSTTTEEDIDSLPPHPSTLRQSTPPTPSLPGRSPPSTPDPSPSSTPRNSPSSSTESHVSTPRQSTTSTPRQSTASTPRQSPASTPRQSTAFTPRKSTASNPRQSAPSTLYTQTHSTPSTQFTTYVPSA